MTPIQLTQDLGVEFWNDSCALNELAEAVEQGASGATSNPVIVGAALDGDKETWLPVLRELIARRPRATEEDLAWDLMEAIAVRAAALLKTGRICVQVNPTFYRDPARMIAQGRHFSTLADN